MKKKGFTLIELLAIIVILAIIALIAVPVVLNIIDKARVSSYERSSENVLESARLYYNESYLDKTTDLSGNKYNTIKDTLSGDTPDDGSQIYIKGNGSIAMLLKYGEHCYTKQFNSDTIIHTQGDACLTSEKEFTNDRILELVTEEYNVTGKLEEIYDAIEDKVGGPKPTTTEVKVNSEEKMAIALGYEDVCYVKNYDEDSFTRTELAEGETCVIPSTVSYKCRRATVLHTEECTQTSSSDYCSGAGYTKDGEKGTTTITYGNKEITEGTLTSGDAFDCDVDGTGHNHRFYYVTDFTLNNEEYAVLVYYNNTTEGVADNSKSSRVPYNAEVQENWHGPVTAITNLPTITQWSNISLSRTSRVIKTETGTTSTAGGSLPATFSYTKTVDGKTVDLAARFLTYKELNAAVKVCGKNSDPTSKGSLEGCDYLLENTKYSSSTLGTSGYWLETPYANGSATAWGAGGQERSVNDKGVKSSLISRSARPAIEVLKSEIEY